MGVRFEVELSDIEKVVDCTKLHEKLESFMVFLKLNDIRKFKNPDVAKKVILTWAWEMYDSDEITAFWEEDLDIATKEAMETQARDIVKSVEDVLFQFKNKTDIMLYWDWDFDKDEMFFELNWNDIVQYTPKVQILDNMDAKFSLVSFDDN